MAPLRQTCGGRTSHAVRPLATNMSSKQPLAPLILVPSRVDIDPENR